MSSPEIAPGNPPLLSVVVGTPLLPPRNDSNNGTPPTAGPALPLASPIISAPSPPPAEAISSPPSPAAAEEPIISPPSPPAEEPIASQPSPPVAKSIATPPPSSPATEPITLPPSPPAQPIAAPPSPPVSTPTPPLPSLPSPSPPPQSPVLTPSTKPPPVTPSSKPTPVTPSAKPPSPPLQVVFPPPSISPPAPTHNNKQTPEPRQPSPSTPTPPVSTTKPSPQPQPSSSPSPRSESSPIGATPPTSHPQSPPQPPATRRGRNVPRTQTSTPTASAPPVSSESPTISKTLPSKPKTSQAPSTLPTLPFSSPGVASSPSGLLAPQPQPPPGIMASPAPPGGEDSGGTGMPDPLMATSNDTVGKPSVPRGAIVGLCIGGVLLVVLLVFAVLLVFCRKRKKFDDGNVKHSKPTFAGLQGKSSKTATEPGLTKEIIDQPGNIQALGTHNGGSGSSNSLPASTTGPNPPVIAITISSGTFSYEELAAATDGFSSSNLLGQGGFGYVHKGVLPNGKEIAVKQLKMGGQQGEREFKAEVETISQVHHKHLVSLVGYCIAGAERLLVYEFVPNQTMEFHLHGKEQPVMEWGTRLKIAVGSAKGLAYLHEDCNPSIIHRDIKAANILLDFNFEAKVADFGLAKIFSNKSSQPITHITTRVMGTFGYLAPEYASSGKVTDKSDVYSFGVMLLELITGRLPINVSESDMNRSLVDWARPLLTQAIADGNYDTLADPRLQNNYNTNEMASMVACAAACIRLSATRRPRMSQVIRSLEGDLSPSDLDDGIRPRDSSMHFPYVDQYMENMRKIKMALTSNNNDSSHVSSSRYSGSTSEYGLQPSVSSTHSPQNKATTTDGTKSTTVKSTGFSR